MSMLAALDTLKRTQATIDAFLKNQDSGIGKGWCLTPIYSDKRCDIGFVDIKKMDAGSCEDHIHIDSVEYLIVVTGKIMFNIEGRDLRVVNAGEVATVPAGKIHHSTPLTDDTRLIYVTVPADPGMAELTKRVHHE